MPDIRFSPPADDPLVKAALGTGPFPLSPDKLPAQIPAPLASFFHLWDQLRAGRPAPCRADIRMESFRGHLGWITLLERAGHDYHYRLVGSHIAETARRDVTGRTFAQCYSAADAAAGRKEVGIVFDGRCHVGAHSRFCMRAPDRGFLTMEGLLLPVSEDGKTIDLVVARYVVGPRLD